MPGAWSQFAFHKNRLPTNPFKEGTILYTSTRHQSYHHRVYETPRPADLMMVEEGAFALLSDLGTILGDQVGEPKYAGPLPMSEEAIMLLSRDIHGFEKLVRASANGEIYHYVLIMQSYGPNWGKESWDPDELYTDASGPLFFYHRTSDMERDVWNFWNITDNYEDPEYGSQTYDINSWWKACSRDWRYMGKKDYRHHEHFQGWSLDPLWKPPSYTIPAPSAPPPDEDHEIPIQMGKNMVTAIGHPGPPAMMALPGYGMCETMKERPTQRTLLSCLPFLLSQRQNGL